MSHGPVKNVAASIHQRLLNLREDLGENFQLILNQYGRERLLYRIAVSPYRDRFILKGAVLFSIWEGEPHRMTQDIDLLGTVGSNLSDTVSIFKEICSITESEDGLLFPADEITAEEIRENQIYGGIRVRISAWLGRTHIPLQIDIGFGDAITPAPVDVNLPSLLNLPGPELRAYPKETVVAEKTHAIVILGMANSRMKDYYDLWILARKYAFEGKQLAEALKATFAKGRQLSLKQFRLGSLLSLVLTRSRRHSGRHFLQNADWPVIGPALRM